MSAGRALLVYATKQGQTEKIARCMAERLEAGGMAVTLVRAERPPAGLDPAAFEVVALGGPVHFGRHPRALRRFVGSHEGALLQRPTLFFSVSGAAGGSSEEERAEADGYVADFLARTGWAPDLTATVAGAIPYTRYSPFLRWVMRRISRKLGRGTDVSRDYEYTDWEQVEELADTVAGMVAGAPQVSGAPPRYSLHPR